MSFNGREYLATPCETCLHNKVCSAKEEVSKTEIKTPHPFLKITLKCSEYLTNAHIK